jgi:predicted DNA-binding transcriptional regulator AlpA
MEPTHRILTKREAAARLRLSDRSLDRLCAANSGLRKIQISPGRVGFLEREIDAFIEKCVSAA